MQTSEAAIGVSDGCTRLFHALFNPAWGYCLRKRHSEVTAAGYLGRWEQGDRLLAWGFSTWLGGSGRRPGSGTLSPGGAVAEVSGGICTCVVERQGNV